MNMLGLGTSGSGGVQAYGSGGGVMPTQWFGQGDVPTPNPELYGSDPLYKKAWDEVQNYHLQKDGQGYSVGSGKDALAAHMASVYARLQGHQKQTTGTAGSGGKTPAQLQKDAFAMFRSQPGYQFGLDEGNKSVQASAAARGGLNSGATLKALLKFGQNYADQQGYTPYMNRLSSLFGGAQTATNQMGQAGQNYANQVGANTINAGQARAGGIYGSANAWSNAGQQIASTAGNYLGYMKSQNDFGGV